MRSRSTAGSRRSPGRRRPQERSRLEHRLVGFVEVSGEFSAGQFAMLAHAEIDQLLAEGKRPIVVGGTGLYLRAALADLELRPPVPPEIRGEVEAEIAARGPEALHVELDPDVAATVHPRDRKRIARALELQRAGIDPPRSSEQLWTAKLRHPTVLVGLTIDREELGRRIEARVEEMVAAGAGGGGAPRRRGRRLPHGPGGARVRGAPGRRSGGGEARPSRLRAPSAHLDAQDAGRGADRPHRPRRSQRRRANRGRPRIRGSRRGRAGDRIASRRCASRSGRRSATTT